MQSQKSAGGKPADLTPTHLAAHEKSRRRHGRGADGRWQANDQIAWPKDKRW
jgi:hypothetical protein